ncbi:XrtX-associated membrane protein [Hymenobacter guriensis]|uniref:Exosortase F system-associated protein n=1 Tax=Hymenobacter guriensis TaxID=2793065 RepID=A0ABS0KYV4_9BACT|nr:hypothetical protein [Hymenobacter guriensis]MBG8553043.1 hypothetical protein [Hymenobacter guriensis]
MPTRSLPARLLWICGLLVLAGFLFCLGAYEKDILGQLNVVWHRYSTYLPTALTGSADPAITRLPVPVVGFYTLLYICLCLLLLRLLVVTSLRFRFILAAYAVSLGACLVLLVLAKLLSGALGLYQLSRNLIDFIVSPLPIMVLAPLVYWYYPTAAPATATK